MKSKAISQSLYSHAAAAAAAAAAFAPTALCRPPACHYVIVVRSFTNAMLSTARILMHACDAFAAAFAAASAAAAEAAAGQQLRAASPLKSDDDQMWR